MTPPNCRTRSELSASSRPPKSEIAESGTTTNRRPKTVPLRAAAEGVRVGARSPRIAFKQI
jgi:hypothetical protein